MCQCVSRIRFMCYIHGCHWMKSSFCFLTSVSIVVLNNWFLGVIVDTLLIITLILIYLKLNLVEGNCEAYGICYDDFVFKKSCYTPNAPPIPINSASATDILKRRCPHLFTETGTYLIIFICICQWVTYRFLSVFLI